MRDIWEEFNKLEKKKFHLIIDNDKSLGEEFKCGICEDVVIEPMEC